MQLNINQQFYVNPIATPMADEKLTKKIIRLTKKLMNEKKLKRGVKEVIKSFRKGLKGIVILAGDVSPIDVISHIPIQCEQKNIPYIYVKSRLLLGIAAQTKKPTSVILMINPEEEKLQSKYQSLYQKILKKNPYITN